jgi:nitrogen fixation/metabolism regulation signal transduction histidine kinase
MKLELSDDDARLLHEVLNSVVSDLSPEIADTDNPQFRRSLEQRRDRLKAILESLPAG